MTRIYGGENYHSAYDASDDQVAGLGGNKLPEVNEHNTLAWPRGYEGREPGAESRDHRAYHHRRGPIGDPCVADQIKDLFRELETLLHSSRGLQDRDRFRLRHREQRDTDGLRLPHREPIDVDRISFPIGKRPPIDADKISFHVEEE